MLFDYKIILFIISCFPLFSYGQITAQIPQNEDVNLRVTQFQAGYMVGATGDVYFFGYNSSPVLEVAHGRRINERFSVLGSAGYENHKNGSLLPFALNLDVLSGRKANQKLKIRLGYSLGISNRLNEKYNYIGGFLGGIDYGFYLFKIKNTALFASIGYQFRRTGLRYQAFEDSHVIKKELDSHFVAFKTGIEF